MQTIDCGDFRKFADAYLDGEFDDRDRAEFDAHVAACSPCRRRLEQHIWFRRGVRSHLRRPERLPPAAQARLTHRLRAASRPARAARWAKRLAVPVPVLAAGAVIFLFTPLTGFAPPLVVDDVIDQHRQRLPVEVPAEEVSEVDAWFQGKLPFEMAAPRFRDARMTLLGGRLARVGGSTVGAPARKAAHLIYGVGSHKVSVVVFQGGDSALWTGDNVQRVGNQEVAFHHAGAHNVAVYHRDGLTYAVTSDLPAAEMVSIVSSAL